MLRATDIWFGYERGADVLRGVSLDVGPDAFLGILGPNGSGKTTLLRLLAGTRQPRRGAITLDRVPLAGLQRSALARRMAVVPQETHLAFDYTAGEVAMMGRYPHLGAFEIEGPGDAAVVRDALTATGTLDLEARQFATLSGGEKQRVVIASALAQLVRAPSADTHSAGGHAGSAPRDRTDVRETPERAGILLLDEPTASLDLKYQLEIARLLQQLHRERHVAIVVSTHDLNLAAAVCQRLVLMRDGSVLAAGAVRDVLTSENIRRTFDVDARIVEVSPDQRLVVPEHR